jgi:hypothetical protein
MRFLVYMQGEGTDPTDDLRGRESLTPVFDNLNTYEVTTHFTARAQLTSTATVRPARPTASLITSTPRRANAS